MRTPSLPSIALAAVVALSCGGGTLSVDAGPGVNPSPCTTSTRGRYLAASIRVTPSTNSSEIDVVVYSDGSAERTLGASSPNGGTGLDPAPMSYPPGATEVVTFLCDLQAAGDVSQIPTGNCAKSISFGTETTVTAGQRTSGDLQCLTSAASAAAVALAMDCDVLTGQKN